MGFTGEVKDRDFLQGDRIRDNGFKLKDSGFRFNIRQKFFTVTLMRQWNRLPKLTVNAPSLKCWRPGGMGL